MKILILKLMIKKLNSLIEIYLILCKVILNNDLLKLMQFITAFLLN